MRMHKALTSYARMLAHARPRAPFLAPKAQLTALQPLARPHGARLLIPCQQQRMQLQRSGLAARSMPEDLDSMLITRRALSSLEPKQQLQHKKHKDSSNSSTTSDTFAPEGSSSISSDSSSLEASEAESSIDWEDVQAHKRAAVQQAFLNDSLGFGFSAGGLVFPYYVGLVSSLVQQGVLNRPAQLAGSSAGSLIAASFNAGLDMDTVERSMIEFGEDCLKNGTRYRLGPLLRDFLDSYLPPNAHELCSGSTHVAVTRLLPYWRTQMVSHFESRDDLMAALLTSCHIPWYFDGRWMTKFRGHFCVDGGVMAFIPTVPEADYTVKVMCFPSSHLSLIKGATAKRKTLKRIHSLVDIDITLDTFEDWPYDLQQVLKWALLASAQETSSLLIEKGKRDGAAWVEAMELGPLVTAKQQQQQEGGVILGTSSSSSSSSSSSTRGDGVQESGVDRQGSRHVEADWSDDKAHQRQLEAEQAHQKTAEAEAAAGGGDPLPRGIVEELLNPTPAAAAAEAEAEMDGGGLSRAAVKHAAEVDVAGVVGPPNKRHKAAAAAATVAAVAGAAAEGVGSLLSGGGANKQQQQQQQEQREE